MLVVSFTLIVMPGMVQAKVAHFVTPLIVDTMSTTDES